MRRVRVWLRQFLTPMTAGARHALIFLVALGLLLQGATLIVGARLYNGLKDSVQTQCASDRDIGNIAHDPVTLNTSTHKASPVVIAFIGDSRIAFYGLGCHGQLKPASPSFVHWAAVYHVPYR